MDTRKKISETLPAGDGFQYVVGTFDPVLADHAADLAAARQPGRKLAVLIEPGGDPILPAAARAELVAGLEAVDVVVVAGGGVTAPAEAIDLTAVHRQRTAALAAHVRRRAG